MAVMGQLLKPKKTEITDKLRQEINKARHSLPALISNPARSWRVRHQPCCALPGRHIDAEP